MIEQVQRVITKIVERVGTQGAAKESLGTPFVISDRKLQLVRCFWCVFQSEILTRDF